MPSVANYMRSQRLDRLIQLYEEVPVKAATGSTSYQYRLMNTNPLFARVRYVTRTQKEMIMGGRETAVQEVHFDMRWRAGVDKVKVIIYDNQYFDIITLIERGRRQLLTCVCTWRDSDNADIDIVV